MKKFAIGVATIVGVFLGALFFMKYMTGHFESGAAAMLCYSALLIVAVMAVMITLSLEEGRIRTALLVAVVLFVAVAAGRNVIGVYNESALNNIDRGISGGFFYATAEVNPDSLDNDQTALEFDKACSAETSRQNGEAEAAALKQYQTDKNLENYRILRLAIADQYKKASEVCKTKGVTISSRFTSEVKNGIVNANNSAVDPNGCVIRNNDTSCWTIRPGSFAKAKPILSDRQFKTPSVSISRDGMSCTLRVPATSADGVKAIDVSGREFKLNKGDEIEIVSVGTVMFSSDHPRSGPEGVNGWFDPDVDSPFNTKVGGLEFAFGSLRGERKFAGSSFKGAVDSDGVPIFRVIERLSGYNDGNSGGYEVKVRIIKKNKGGNYV